jgi:hypothetical protein
VLQVVGQGDKLHGSDMTASTERRTSAGPPVRIPRHDVNLGLIASDMGHDQVVTDTPDGDPAF